MAQKRSLAGKVVGWVFSEASLHLFWTYGFPPLLALATAAAGIMEKQPIMWVLAASSMSFAMTALGLLAFHQWRFRRTPEHKVVFSRILVNRHPPDTADRVVLGFAMNNIADFPLEVVLTRLHYSLASRIPAPAPVPRILKVDAQTTFHFTGGIIDISGVTEEVMSGEIEYTFEYGRIGSSQKYTITKAQVLSVPLDSNKPFNYSEKLMANEQVGKIS